MRDHEEERDFPSEAERQPGRGEGAQAIETSDPVVCSALVLERSRRLLESSGRLLRQCEQDREDPDYIERSRAAQEYIDSTTAQRMEQEAFERKQHEIAQQRARAEHDRRREANLKNGRGGVYMARPMKIPGLAPKRK